MDKFSELKIFVSIIEFGSLSAAAEKLGLNKSVLSSRIKSLEKRLGVQLFERGTQLIATGAGDIFFAKAQKILLDLDEAETSAKHSNDDLSGTLKIAASMAFTVTCLGEILSNFAKLHKDLKIELDATDRRINLLNETHYDLEIRVGPLEDSSLLAKTIVPNRHAICASPSYLKEHGTPKSPNELKSHFGVLYSHRDPNDSIKLVDEGGIKSFKIIPRIRTDNGFQIRAAIEQGLGIGVLPTFMLVEALDSGRAVEILHGMAPPGGTISVVYRRGNRNSARIRLLVDYMKSVMTKKMP